MNSNSWPEQDAIEAWFDKYGIVPPTTQASLELKTAVTAHRIQMQQMLTKHLSAAATQFRLYEKYHREKGTEDSLQKAEKNRELAEQLEGVIRDYSAFVDSVSKQEHLAEVRRFQQVIQLHMQDGDWLLRQMGICRESQHGYNFRTADGLIDRVRVLVRLGDRQSRNVLQRYIENGRDDKPNRKVIPPLLHSDTKPNTSSAYVRGHYIHKGNDCYELSKWDRLKLSVGLISASKLWTKYNRHPDE